MGEVLIRTAAICLNLVLIHEQVNENWQSITRVHNTKSMGKTIREPMNSDRQGGRH